MLDEYYLFCEFCGEGLDENDNCPDCDDFYDDNQEYGYLDDIRPGVDYVDYDWYEDDIYKEDYLYFNL